MSDFVKLFQTKPDVRRLDAGLICALMVASCFGYAWIRNDLPQWWAGHGGGIPYVMFWISLAFVILPFRKCVIPICLVATLATCGLEFLQLWQPEWLTKIRATRFGAALLGSGFVWKDFPPYLMGGVLGYVVLFAVMWVRPTTKPRQSRRT